MPRSICMSIYTSMSIYGSRLPVINRLQLPLLTQGAFSLNVGLCRTLSTQNTNCNKSCRRQYYLKAIKLLIVRNFAGSSCYCVCDLCFATHLKRNNTKGKIFVILLPDPVQRFGDHLMCMHCFLYCTHTIILIIIYYCSVGGQWMKSSCAYALT